MKVGEKFVTEFTGKPTGVTLLEIPKRKRMIILKRSFKIVRETLDCPV
jgi:hypothetical protein